MRTHKTHRPAPAVLIVSFLCCFSILCGLWGCAKKEAATLPEHPEISYEAPEWYRDAKFGIFIHYGVYSVPAFGDEWYGHWMYIPNSSSYGNSDIYTHHLETYGGAKAVGYKDFIPDFLKGISHWKQSGGPEQWAELFEAAGAKYVVPVGIHHDSYALYASDIQKTYNSVNGAGVDYLGALKEAVTARGMKFGVSNHFAENDWFFDEEAGKGTDLTDPAYAELYGVGGGKTKEHVEKWYAISMEIIEKYRPDLIYYDFDLGNDAFNTYEDANRYKMLSEYYALAKTWEGNEGVVCNYKYDAFSPYEAVQDKERETLGEIRPVVWQTDTSVGAKSWGYVTDEVYRTGEEFIGALIDIVSKNGNLLLNVGPMADGTVPPESRAILETIGAWLGAYGDAIYATRPWTVYGEGDAENRGDSYVYTGRDIRFTKSKDGSKLYISALGTPENGRIAVTTLGSRRWNAETVKEIALLQGGGRLPLAWEQTEEALNITLPEGLHGACAVEVTFTDGTIPQLAQPAGGAVTVNEENGYLLDFTAEDTVFLAECTGEGSIDVLADGQPLCTVDVPAYENASRTVCAVVPAQNGVRRITLSANGADITRFRFCKQKTAAEKIEAEDYDLARGCVRAEPCADGGENLGYVGSGDTVCYAAVDFGDGCKKATVRLAGSGQTCRLRLDAPDGEILCEPGADTGGWTSYQTLEYDIPEVSGVHTVYITYDTGWSDLNVDWFAFS